MPKFIQVTSHSHGTLRLINIDNICLIGEFDNITRIYFNGEKDDYIQVRESYAILSNILLTISR